MYDILTVFVCPNAIYSIPYRDDEGEAHNKGWRRIGVNVFKNGKKYKTFRSVYAASAELGFIAATLIRYMDKKLPLKKNNVTWIFERINNAHTRTETSS
jgi:hypothetical protein